MSDDPKYAYKFKFGEFTLDPRRGALLKKGDEIKLRPQSFDVLRILVTNQGNLVSKQDLHAKVWRNKVVTDDSITHCLLDIRKALGDTDKKAIRTLPRRGYIFDLPCERLAYDESFSVLQPKSPWFVVTALVATSTVSILAGIWFLDIGGLRSLASIPKNSIAVLPFADVSESQDQQYLGDGLSGEILYQLSRSDALRVIARTSTFSFAERSPDIPTIRDALNVRYVLEGSVNRTGERMVVTAQLIDTRNSVNVWSDRYEREAQELLAIQIDIAESVLTHISPTADATLAPPATLVHSANELMFLAGVYEHRVRGEEAVDKAGLELAIRFYRDAVKADPNSALAHSRLASALLYAGDIAGAEEPTNTALRLDPNISEVQETYGQFLWIQGKPGFGEAWEKAIKLNPNNADALSNYGYWAWMQGLDGPTEFYERALDLDRLSLERYGALGEAYAHLAMVPEALAVSDRVEELFDSAAAFRLIARINELTGRIDESIAWTIRARDREPENKEHVAALAELFVEIGDHETALILEPNPSIGLLYKMRRYKEVTDLGEELLFDHPGDIELRYVLAYSHNVLGNAERAITILRESGQPGTVRPEARFPSDIEALVTFIDALFAHGESVEASELAEWWEARAHTNNPNWWIWIYRACPLALNGFEDRALDFLVSVANSPRLPWDIHIRDMPCFQGFVDDPRYQAMLEQVDARRRDLREQLPVTLRNFGVEL